MDYTGNLSKQIVSWRVNDSSSVSLDERGHHLSVSRQCADSCVIILAREATVTSNVRTQNGGEFAPEGFGGHGTLSFLRERITTTDGES